MLKTLGSINNLNDNMSDTYRIKLIDNDFKEKCFNKTNVKNSIWEIQMKQ